VGLEIFVTGKQAVWILYILFLFCIFLSCLLLVSFYLLIVGVEVIVSINHTQWHNHSIGLLWTRGRSVAETSPWQHITLTRDRHSCPPAGCEPAIPASERPQTHTLDRAATGSGFVHVSFWCLVTRNSKDRTEQCASWSPLSRSCWKTGISRSFASVRFLNNSSK
jgi:hypothetical protein